MLSNASYRLNPRSVWNIVEYRWDRLLICKMFVDFRFVPKLLSPLLAQAGRQWRRPRYWITAPLRCPAPTNGDLICRIRKYNSRKFVCLPIASLVSSAVEDTHEMREMHENALNFLAYSFTSLVICITFDYVNKIRLCLAMSQLIIRLNIQLGFGCRSRKTIARELG